MKARESCSVPVARFVPEPFNECKDKLPLVYICSRYRGKDETDVREHIRWAKAFSCCDRRRPVLYSGGSIRI